jgi:hypothetical protein
VGSTGGRKGNTRSNGGRCILVDTGQRRRGGASGAAGGITVGALVGASGIRGRKAQGSGGGAEGPE